MTEAAKRGSLSLFAERDAERMRRIDADDPQFLREELQLLMSILGRLLFEKNDAEDDEEGQHGGGCVTAQGQPAVIDWLVEEIADDGTQRPRQNVFALILGRRTPAVPAEMRKPGQHPFDFLSQLLRNKNRDERL